MIESATIKRVICYYPSTSDAAELQDNYKDRVGAEWATSWITDDHKALNGPTIYIEDEFGIRHGPFGIDYFCA
jgi:hypothetical protein